MKWNKSIFVVIPALLAILGSCTLWDDFSDEAKAADLEGVFLLSHLEAVDLIAAYQNGSRAAVPGSSIDYDATLRPTAQLALPLAARLFSNYPEVGLDSTVTISSHDSANSLWLVNVTTSYFGGKWADGVRQSTVEEYYVKDDATPTGFYTKDDHITDAAGIVDTSGLARKQIATTYITKRTKTDRQSTSVRYETITSGKGSPGYFSFKAEPLTYSWSYTPSSGETVNWSSAVSYTQTLPADQLKLDELITSSSTTYYLEGKRYYTEVPTTGTSDPINNHEASSIAFERVYDGPSTASNRRLIVEAVIRVAYTRVNGVPSASDVQSKVWYYLNALDPPLIVEKVGLQSSTPIN